MVRQRDIGGGIDRFHEHLVGIVLAALIFVAHDRHFRLPIALAQQQAPHPIRFDRNVAVEVFAADRREISRAINRGVCVVLAADALEILFDAVALAVVVAFAALEHHVFEDVGRTRGAGNLVAGTDAIGHLERHDRRRMIGHEQDREIVVGETVFVGTAGRLHEFHAGDDRGGLRGLLHRRGRLRARSASANHQ
jgi:hypothetical protein